MPANIPWLAVTVVITACAVLAALVLVLLEVRRRTPPLSAAERRDLAATPMTSLQKIAWGGLFVGVLEILAIVLLIQGRGGADVYWEDDGLRLQVLGVFLAGLILSAILLSLAALRADERERGILSTGVRVQAVALLLTCALGSVYLTHRFHDAGAIPVVYAYLGLGLVFIVYMVANFLGILLGFGAARFHGQG